MQCGLPKGNWDGKRKLVSCQKQSGVREAISQPCLLWRRQDKSGSSKDERERGLSNSVYGSLARMSVGRRRSRDNTPFLEKGLVGELVGLSVDEERLSGVSMHRS